MSENIKEFTVFLVIIVFFTIGINFLKKTINLDKVISEVNHKEYYVRKLPDKQEAANILGKLTIDLNSLINNVKDDDRDGVDRLFKRFKSDIITENIPGSTYIAYSVNKGDELSICIRDRKTEKFLDYNTTVFVSIHELAHIMSKSRGHTEEFWLNMKYLLIKASEIGIYTQVDYSKNPTTYCGQEINSTPMNL
jgi:hypothetical protein